MLFAHFDYATDVGLSQRQFAKQTVGGSTPAGGKKEKTKSLDLVFVLIGQNYNLLRKMII